MATSNYKNSNGTDLGSLLVEKSYLIDRYPELVDQYRFAGLWVAGGNSYGQLGLNNRTGVSTPVQTVSGGTTWKQVSTSLQNMTAIKSDGTLWCWGHNSYGQLGTNDTTHRSSPVQTVAYGTNWKQVSSSRHNTAAIKTNGTLWVWGRGGWGNLGTADLIHRSSPIQTVAYGTNWKQVVVGVNHTVAIKTDGTLWAWGNNDEGQLGTNDRTTRTSPIQTVAYGTNWKQATATTNAGSTAAIKADGTLWVWGYNSYGQLGINNTAPRSSPMQTVAYGTNWKQVSMRVGLITAAIKTDGTLWVWGNGASGALGTNDPNNRSSPVQTVTYGTNWKQVDVGHNFMLAVKTDGTLWGWGSNTNGQLGTGNTSSTSSPVQTVLYGTNWKQVACGYYHSVAIKDDSEDLW